MKSSTRAHWDTFWRQPDPQIAQLEFNPKLVNALVRALGDLRGKRLLEAGCGAAVDSIEFSRLGAEVTAYDYSNEALITGTMKAAAAGVSPHFVQGDILALPYADQTFDAVFHAGVLEHFREPSIVLKEQHRVMKSAGVLVVDVPQTFNLYTVDKARQIRNGTWFAGWETQFSIRELETLLQDCRFEVIDAYGYGYYPAFYARMRWLSSLGIGVIGRPFMPKQVAHQYDQIWERIEETRAFLYTAQCIGVICQKVE